MSLLQQKWGMQETLGLGHAWSLLETSTVCDLLTVLALIEKENPESTWTYLDI